jgi:hypothetical protein
MCFHAARGYGFLIPRSEYIHSLVRQGTIFNIPAGEGIQPSGSTVDYLTPNEYYRRRKKIQRSRVSLMP